MWHKASINYLNSCLHWHHGASATTWIRHHSSVLSAPWAISHPVIGPFHGLHYHCGSSLPRQGTKGFSKPSHYAVNLSSAAASQHQSFPVHPGNHQLLISPGIIALPVSKSNGSILPAAPTCRPKSDSAIFLWFQAQRQAEHQVSALNTARHSLNQGIRVPKTASARNFSHTGLVLK